MTLESTIVIRDPKGLHARPVALLAARLKMVKLSARLSVRPATGSLGRSRSVELGHAQRLRATSLLALGAREADTLVFSAQGPDAEVVLELVEETLGAEKPLTPAEIMLELEEFLGGADPPLAFYRRFGRGVAQTVQSFGRRGLALRAGGKRKDFFKVRNR